jgi:hypothetical protein
MLALPALWYGSLSMLLAVIALREPTAAARPDVESWRLTATLRRFRLRG